MIRSLTGAIGLIDVGGADTASCFGNALPTGTEISLRAKNIVSTVLGTKKTRRGSDLTAFIENATAFVAARAGLTKLNGLVIAGVFVAIANLLAAPSRLALVLAKSRTLRAFGPVDAELTLAVPIVLTRRTGR